MRNNEMKGKNKMMKKKEVPRERREGMQKGVIQKGRKIDGQIDGYREI